MPVVRILRRINGQPYAYSVKSENPKRDPKHKVLDCVSMEENPVFRARQPGPL
jgi:hypothetical protein